MRILAVDDEPLFLDLLRGVLVSAGYNSVDTAPDADTALAMIRQSARPYDCFLLDIRMPGKDGIELCQMIRAMPEYRITPVLMLTAALEEATVDRAFAAGATDYVTKPLKGLELGARIRSASLLAEQMRKSMGLQQTAERMRERLDELMKAPLSAPLDLAAGPACVGLLQLERMLFLLPEGVYAMNVFVMRVPDIATIHATMDQQGFQAMLAEVAQAISEKIGARQHYVAYAGEGLFACVVLGRDRSTAGAETGPAALRNGLSVMAESWGGRLRLSYSQSADWQLLTGQGGTEALRLALSNAAQLNVLDRRQRALDRDRLGREVIVPRRPRLANIFSRERQPEPQTA